MTAHLPTNPRAMRRLMEKDPVTVQEAVMAVDVILKPLKAAYGAQQLGTILVLAAATAADEMKDPAARQMFVENLLHTFGAEMPGDGLPAAQEPKYTTVGGRLVNRASGKPIPDDEPVFIFRAQDVFALKALQAYADVLTEGPHLAVVWQRIEDFQRFAREHVERMKLPDSAPLADAQPAAAAG